MGRIIDLRNNTTSDILIPDLGVLVPANVDDSDTKLIRITDSLPLDRVNFSKDLETLLSAGTLSVNGRDGSGDGTVATNLGLSDAADEVSVAVVAAQLKIKYGESANEVTTTGLSYLQHLRLNFDASAAEHLVQWFAEVSSSHSSAHVLIRIELDDVTVVDTAEWQPGNILSPAGEQPFVPISGFQKVQIDSGNHNVDLDFAGTKSGRAVTVRKTRLSVTKL